MKCGPCCSLRPISQKMQGLKLKEQEEKPGSAASGGVPREVGGDFSPRLHASCELHVAF